MKTIRRALSLIFAILMVMTLFTACGNKDADTASEGSEAAPEGIAALGNKVDIFNDEVKIAYIPLSSLGQGNILVADAFAEQLIFYDNVVVDTFEAGYDPTTQISLINEAVTQGYQAIILEAADAAALANAVEAAEEAGVPVVTFNCGCDGKHVLHIQGSDYAAGWMGAEVVAEALGNEGKAIILDCPAEQVSSSRMGLGFEAYMKENTNIEIIDYQNIANWSQENANTTMRDLLTKYDDIDAVYGSSDDIAMGAVQAIEAAGRQDEGILVWGNIGYPSSLTAIKEGRMFGTTYSNYYVEASTSIYFALYFIQNGITSVTAGYESTPTVDQGALACTAENVDDIIAISHWDM